MRFAFSFGTCFLFTQTERFLSRLQHKLKANAASRELVRKENQKATNMAISICLAWNTDLRRPPKYRRTSSSATSAASELAVVGFFKIKKKHTFSGVKGENTAVFFRENDINLPSSASIAGLSRGGHQCTASDIAW